MELLKSVRNVDESKSPLIDNILATLQLISIRIDSYELYKNPSTITSATQPNISIYKKFDKARFILHSQAKAKKVNIDFHNSSYFSISGYEIFDLLPYILFDNAIKYSFKNQDIDVYFDDKNRQVAVKNIGPQISQEQLPSIFEHGYRAKYASTFDGTGLGLFLAKQIAELHQIKLLAESQEEVEFRIHGIPYSEFTMMLSFP
jgi:signal transduction histidine kinase